MKQIIWNAFATIGLITSCYLMAFFLIGILHQKCQGRMHDQASQEKAEKFRKKFKGCRIGRQILDKLDEI